MSYPKVPPKPQTTTTSKLSNERKERLLKLQEREELKGLLINKFKVKYGGKGTLIEKEVDDFIKKETLTESNLRKLDQRIKDRSEGAQEQARTPPPEDAKSVSDRGSRRSGPKSVASHQSRMDNIDDDQMSVYSSSTKKGSIFVPDDDTDEWAAILAHDTQLFRDEERTRMQREHENKIKLRRELDRQKKEMEERKKREMEEEMLYEESKKKNLDMIDNREQQKTTDYKNKVMQEKNLRDKQLQDEKRRKKDDTRQQKEMDSRTVKRLQEELLAEQRSAEQKRLDQIAYARRMMEENERNKKILLDFEEQERVNDIRSMEDYARMLDKQEADRAAEVEEREKRQQQLMARMADTVIKEQNQKAREEDIMLLRQVEERERLDQMEDDRRRQRLLEEQRRTKEILDRQVLEREQRKQAERQSQQEQAEMWKQDSDDFFQMEEEKKRRQKEYNLAQASALKQQIQEKNSKKKKRAYMSTTEAALNQGLLKEIHRDEDGLSIQGESIHR